jgi:outer membrane receptor for ferrienterochelin and colicin
MLFSFSKNLTMKLTFVFVFAFLLQISLTAQHKLNGTVYDATFNEPVPFAHVVNSESGKGTISDEKGIFSIEIESGSELIISAIGYKSEKIEVPDTSDLKIYLTPMKYMLNEVNVYASSKSTESSASSTHIKAKEAEQLAGMTRDIFRSVQMLPGVSTNNEVSANFQVRGGTYEENLVLINGIRVNEPFHLKSEPATSIGIFNIDLIRNIDFMAGGFSAEYGDVLSGILNVDYKEGNREKYQGKINLSMLDLGFCVEGPVSQKSSFILGARHSYLDYMLKLMDVDDHVEIGYYDIQGKYDYRFSSRHRLSLTAIYSDDYFRYGPTSWNRLYNGDYTLYDTYTLTESSNDYYENQKDDYSNTLLSLISTNVLSNKFSLRTECSYYAEEENENYEFSRDQHTLFNEFPEYFYGYHTHENYGNSLEIKTYEVNTKLKYLLSHAHSFSAGIYYRLPFYNYSNEQIIDRMEQHNIDTYPDTVTYLFPDDPNNHQLTKIETQSYFTGGFIQHHWQINGRIIITSGIRADYFNFNREFDISPRLNLAYQLTPATKIRGAWGIYYQTPNYRQLKDTVASADNTQNQRAIHYIAGIEQKINEKMHLKFEMYYKNYTDLIPVRRTSSGQLFYEVKDIVAEGYARGADMEFMYRGKKVNFMMTYGLLDAKEKMKDEENYHSRYTDQTHTLSAILSVLLPHKFELNLRGFYGSGFAYQQMVVTYNETENYYQWSWPEIPITAKFPSYQRIDFRASKEFGIGKNKLLVYFDIINILNKENAYSYRYTYNSNGDPIIETISLFPLMPTLGISYEF